MVRRQTGWKKRKRKINKKIKSMSDIFSSFC